MHTESCETCKVRRPGWFCDLPLDALAEYDALSIHIMAPSGTILFNEGQRPHGVSIVCAGQAKLTKASPEGKTLLVRVVRPGEVLGLSAALLPSMFPRIHRSFIVNLNFVAEIRRDGPKRGTVLMKDGTELAMSRLGRGNIKVGCT